MLMYRLFRNSQHKTRPLRVHEQTSHSAYPYSTCCRTLENLSMAIFDSEILRPFHEDEASRMNQQSDLVLQGRQTYEGSVYDRHNLCYLILYKVTSYSLLEYPTRYVFNNILTRLYGVEQCWRTRIGNDSILRKEAKRTEIYGGRLTKPVQVSLRSSCHATVVINPSIHPNPSSFFYEGL